MRTLVALLTLAFVTVAAARGEESFPEKVARLKALNAGTSKPTPTRLVSTADQPGKDDADPFQPTAPKKSCGKCGSEDCGCQTDKAVSAMRREAAATSADVVKLIGMMNARLDAAEKRLDQMEQRPTTATVSTPAAKPIPAHVVDATGRWWMVADKDDDDQRSWYSDTGGRHWYRDEGPALRQLAQPVTCNCPATGNKDGSKGPNNCLCHDMGLDCKCHKNAGILYNQLPATALAPMVTPARVAATMMMAPVMRAAPVRRTLLPFAGSGSAAACST